MRTLPRASASLSTNAVCYAARVGVLRWLARFATALAPHPRFPVCLRPRERRRIHLICSPRAHRQQPMARALIVGIAWRGSGMGSWSNHSCTLQAPAAKTHNAYRHACAVPFCPYPHIPAAAPARHAAACLPAAPPPPQHPHAPTLPYPFTACRCACRRVNLTWWQAGVTWADWSCTAPLGLRR